ncbi:MAG TPA: GntR family transcriptional regulator [Solirubrobacteraceae bacterium]|jgi:GntR family transcriptional regulator
MSSSKNHQKRPGQADEVRSLVDVAEQSVAHWLLAGRYRPGDRLPPEHDLAGMLGISRGTLRSALERLAERGEIVRRQGSGTYVGRLVSTSMIGERLERLEPYSSLAARRGLTLTCRQLTIELGPVEDKIAHELGLASIAQAYTISRTLVAGDAPVAVMIDVVHPSVELPRRDRLRTALERGRMVLDVLIENGLAITFARTSILPHLVSGRDAAGRELGVRGATAVLQLEEVVYAGAEQPVAFSRDLFAPGGIDVTVTRSLESALPTPVAELRRPRGRARNRSSSSGA